MGGRGSTGLRGRGGSRTSTVGTTPRSVAPTKARSGAPAYAGDGSPITREQMESMSDRDFVRQYVENNMSGTRARQLMSQGLNGRSATQVLVHDLGMNDKPQIVDNATFDAMAAGKGAVVIHRGVGHVKSIKNTLNSDTTWLGNGIFGDGLYFSTRKSTAASYAGSYRGAVRHNAMTAMINPKTAKICDARVAMRAVNNASSPASAWKSAGDREASCWAIKHGYNVMRVKGTYSGGAHEDFYVVLDRSALIVRKDTLVH